MITYRDPINTVFSVIVAAFLMAGAMLCLGACLGFRFAADETDDLLEMLFWPAVGAVSFAVAFFVHWITEPVRYHLPEPHPRQEK